MELNLNKKVVVISGGATGIGREAAREFVKEGAIVAIFGRREEPLKEFHDEMKRDGMDIYYESLDVTDTEGVKAYAGRIFDRFGSLDVWINNAGIAINKELLDFTEDDWQNIYSINMKAVYECTRIAASYMKKQGGGVIMNASSFAAKIPHANGVIYAATKAAVSNMTKSTAAALAPYGIRVVGYIPGMIVTPISEEFVAEYRDKFTKDIALKRLGHPEDLAKPLVFLASDAASYITGVDIEISGGKFAVQDCDMAYRMRDGKE